MSLVQKVLQKELGEKVLAELKFHTKRQWRFDFAVPSCFVAIEQEGGIWKRGRHVRGKGYLNDMEKYNSAVELGWVVLRYSPDQMLKTKTLDQIKKVCENRKRFRKLAQGLKEI